MYQLFGTTDPAGSAVHLLRQGEQTAQVVLVAGILQFALWNQLSLGVIDRFVCHTHHMQDDGVVRFVRMVVVFDPITRRDMNLDVSNPLLTIYTDTRMAIVRTGIMVVLSPLISMGAGHHHHLALSVKDLT